LVAQVCLLKEFRVSFQITLLTFIKGLLGTPPRRCVLRRVGGFWLVLFCKTLSVCSCWHGAAVFLSFLGHLRMQLFVVLQDLWCLCRGLPSGSRPHEVAAHAVAHEGGREGGRRESGVCTGPRPGSGHAPLIASQLRRAARNQQGTRSAALGPRSLSQLSKLRRSI
jgi:hypothetical protein